MSDGTSNDVFEREVTTDELLTSLRDGLRRLDGMYLNPTQAQLVTLFRALDDALVNGDPLPEDWQGERDGYVTGYYRPIGGQFDSTNDPNEQE